jgi:hypothetical protein
MKELANVDIASTINAEISRVRAMGKKKALAKLSEMS